MDDGRSRSASSSASALNMRPRGITGSFRFLLEPIFPARRNNASLCLLRARTPVTGRVAAFLGRLPDISPILGVI
jgi:hypothetical protein